MLTWFCLFQISVARVQLVLFNVTDALPTFSNAAQPDDLGPYRIPIEFKHQNGAQDFTLLRMSPNKGCAETIEDEIGISEEYLKNENIPISDLYIQQVSFECTLELANAGSALTASNFIEAVPVFDPIMSSSHCVLYPAQNTQSLAVLDKLSLTLRVTARDFEYNYEVHSKALTIPFIPAFFVDKHEVLLKGPDSTADLIVSGISKQLQNIQVHVQYFK